jgi:hypothetical protein
MHGAARGEHGVGEGKDSPLLNSVDARKRRRYGFHDACCVEGDAVLCRRAEGRTGVFTGVVELCCSWW